MMKKTLKFLYVIKRHGKLNKNLIKAWKFCKHILDLFNRIYEASQNLRKTSVMQTDHHEYISVNRLILKYKLE